MIFISPVRAIYIMMECMNTRTKYKISMYGMFRNCVDYLAKTDWFFNLSHMNQFEIRFDFYAVIVVGIHESFNRV